jgi:hypothetical protein
MKIPRAVLICLLFPMQPLTAQRDIPDNPMVKPKGFKTHSVGSGTNTGATVKTAETAVRYVTHIVLFEYRMWSSAEGKPLEGKLLAFEDLVAEAPPGATPTMPAPPPLPTVVRNGSVRLLVGQKAVVVPLARLSVADREFIRDIETTLARKTGKPSPETPRQQP